jgi:hypothetical protein
VDQHIHYPRYALGAFHFAFIRSSPALGVWALELNIEDEYDDDGESMKSWKMD